MSLQENFKMIEESQNLELSMKMRIKKRLDGLEQRTRMSNLEITGVPEMPKKGHSSTDCGSFSQNLSNNTQHGHRCSPSCAHPAEVTKTLNQS